MLLLDSHYVSGLFFYFFSDSFLIAGGGLVVHRCGGGHGLDGVGQGIVII
jgi:hypothetical protein